MLSGGTMDKVMLSIARLGYADLVLVQIIRISVSVMYKTSSIVRYIAKLRRGKEGLLIIEYLFQ